MISIITTSYNYGEYISQTIKSVLAQTFSDWELIIVDDASSDNSVEIIKDFQAQDSRIILICHDENKGLQESIKTGLQHAKGEWIAFLESDDYWEDNALEERLQVSKNANIIFNSVNLVGDAEWIEATNSQVKKMKKNLQHAKGEWIAFLESDDYWEDNALEERLQVSKNANIIFNSVNLVGDAEWIEATNSQVKKNEKKLATKIFPKKMFKNFMTNNPILTLSCVMLKKEVLSETYFNSPVDKLFDWWLYIHIAYVNEFYYINKKLTNWRLHPSSYIKTRTKKSFKLVNAMAYFDVYKQRKALKILPIAVLCLVEMCFVRFRIYFIGFIRFIKKIIGFKNKKSPLFD